MFLDYFVNPKMKKCLCAARKCFVTLLTNEYTSITRLEILKLKNTWPIDLTAIGVTAYRRNVYWCVDPVWLKRSSFLSKTSI